MYNFPIGAIVDCFRCETREAVKKAAAIGAKGLQMYSTTGVNSPENLKGSKAKDLLNFVKSEGLVFSALCGDLGKGFGNKDLNPELIEKSKRILDLAKELETDIVTTHIGVVPADETCERYKVMQEACFELSRFADSLGAHFAIETGPEPSAVLKKFLDSLDSTGVAVNLDPANLIMVTGDDPVQAVYNLKDYIVHTHAKDGVMLTPGNPEIIYGVINAPEDVKKINHFKEVPLGTGSVNFPAYLKALEDIGYKGFLTIEREVGDNPEADIKTAYEFLTKVIKEN
ncbi:MAG: sugar phosphate isomerase/epimerase family protein [Bacillota bacterium]|nr:sugar phosphate isomerase/epimerase family protein [Bacillota bacterium]